MKPWPLENSLSIMITLVVLLSTVLVGLGQRSPVLSVLALVVALVSVYVTDRKRWFQASPRVADLAASIAILITIWLAMQGERNDQVTALANLMSYLQYVLLFHKKSNRVYWQLALLSLGQVAIASTLVTGPIFGLILLLYLFAGVVGLAMARLHFDSQQFLAIESASLRPADAAGTVSSRGAAARPRLVGSAAAMPDNVGSGLMRQGAWICLLTVALASVIYFALPRWSVIDGRAEIDTHTVGFTKTVTLGEMGDVVNNPDLVMRVQFFHGSSRRPFKLENEPLFRGAVLNNYRLGRNVWTQSENNSTMVMPKLAKADFVRQRITFEPADETELFSIFPAFALQTDARLRVNLSGEQIFRQEDLLKKQLEFEIGTTGIVGERQRSILPRDETLDDLWRYLVLAQSSRPRADTDVFAGLKEQAASIVRELDLDPKTDRVAAARALSDYFHTSNKYYYSLEQQRRDPLLDPLEDFVTKRHYGHCEYFAGALVLMLRSLDIPARMVVGFKGGEWNELGSFYQVQQLHAHAWVEAYLRQGDIPPGEFDEDEMPAAAWLVLDPTEGTSEGSQVLAQNTLWSRIRQYYDFGHMMWNYYVSGLNASRQRQGIYDPLAEGAYAAVDNLVSADVWQARLKYVARSSLGIALAWYRDHWFSWKGGLVAIAFCSLLAACYGLGRAATRLLVWLGWLRDSRRELDAAVHEIYRRLEAALARGGLVRRPAQTAHEFAAVAGGELAERIDCRRVAHLPRRVVDSFYRVRFGGRTLDKSEADAVEHALSELEQVLAAGPRHGSTSLRRA